MRRARRAIVHGWVAVALATCASGCLSEGKDGEPAASAGPALEPCGRTVTTPKQLVQAAVSPRSRDRVVCAARGDYGTVTFENVHHPAGKGVTLRSKTVHRAVLSGVQLRDVRGLRLEGFRVTGGVDNAQDPVRDVEFVGNDIGGGTSSAFILKCSISDVLIEGNHIHDLRATPDWWTGFGVSVDGPPSCGVRRNLRIRYNTIERVEKDGVTLGEVHGGELVGNTIREVDTGHGDPDFHTDSLMIWANSEGLLVQDNRITDGNGVVVSGTRGLRFENNLVARIDNWCWQNGSSGSTEAAPIDTAWVNNTVYDCGSDYDGGGFGGGYAFIIDGVMPAGNVAVRNLLGNLAGSTRELSASKNLIHDGPLASASDRRFAPEFGDGDDWKPAKLPAGYEKVGYRAAPAGHRAAPVAQWWWRPAGGS